MKYYSLYYYFSIFIYSHLTKIFILLFILLTIKNGFCVGSEYLNNPSSSMIPANRFSHTEISQMLEYYSKLDFQPEIIEEFENSLNKYIKDNYNLNNDLNTKTEETINAFLNVLYDDILNFSLALEKSIDNSSIINQPLETHYTVYAERGTLSESGIMQDHDLKDLPTRSAKSDFAEDYKGSPSYPPSTKISSDEIELGILPEGIESTEDQTSFGNKKTLHDIVPAPTSSRDEMSLPIDHFDVLNAEYINFHNNFFYNSDIKSIIEEKHVSERSSLSIDQFIKVFMRNFENESSNILNQHPSLLLHSVRELSRTRQQIPIKLPNGNIIDGSPYLILIHRKYREFLRTPGSRGLAVRSVVNMFVPIPNLPGTVILLEMTQQKKVLFFTLFTIMFLKLMFL